jgi:two-component system, chemotaxis family, sensor kinase CheA
MIFDAVTRARLVGVFVAEAEETLASLCTLTRGILGTGDAVPEFGRLAHGLKGAAGSVGFERLASALHALEDLALRIPRAAPGAAAELQQRIARALALMAEGIARMSASGQDGFPEDVLGPLLEAVAAPGAAPAAAVSDPGEATPASAPAAEAPVLERLSVPAADVDAALRVGAALARAAAQLHEALGDGAALASSAQALAISARELEGIISSLRLLPAEAALSGLEEEVAELAAVLGKKVVLATSGREVRADRRTLQSARGMIRHLVRNAVDHGLESPERRLSAGKDETGRLAVTVEAGESALRVTVADDGSGFDLPAIRQEMARRTGDGDRIASLSDDEALQLWAFEGGSTRASATEISGRGLGLSAVAKMARAAGGGIQIRSGRGTGSRIFFTVPLEVYAVEVLAVSAGGRTFGIPLHAVARTVHLDGSGSGANEGPAGLTLAVGETILPLVPLLGALGAPDVEATDRFAVVLHVDADMLAISVEDVDSVVGVVPAAVPGVAHADGLVTGIAQLGDGTALAVLNPRRILSAARAARRAAPRVRRAPAPEPVAKPAARLLEVILAEDSLSTREVLRVLLEEQGFRVRLAGDGEEALQRIAERLPDVVVSDVNMPRRDGLSLTRELRRRHDTARLPIVLLTSLDDAASRSAGAAAGADAYLVKSRFNAGVLQETLARLGVGSRP